MPEAPPLPFHAHWRKKKKKISFLFSFFVKIKGDEINALEYFKEYNIVDSEFSLAQFIREIADDATGLGRKSIDSMRRLCVRRSETWLRSNGWWEREKWAGFCTTNGKPVGGAWQETREEIDTFLDTNCPHGNKQGAAADGIRDSGLCKRSWFRYVKTVNTVSIAAHETPWNSARLKIDPRIYSSRYCASRINIVAVITIRRSEIQKLMA